MSKKQKSAPGGEYRRQLTNHLEWVKAERAAGREPGRPDHPVSNAYLDWTQQRIDDKLPTALDARMALSRRALKEA